MLSIVIKNNDGIWDEKTQQFITMKEKTLQLEHSLISISKWESKWHKSYFKKEEKTYEETIDYIRCMSIKDIDPNILFFLSKENIDEISRYINDSMTATVLPKDESASREIITSELVYYWMLTCGIPIECEKWHINRLLTLIGVFSVKNKPPKKHSQKEIMSRNKALNDARRKQLKTKG